jgi:hypothetical protein
MVDEDVCPDGMLHKYEQLFYYMKRKNPTVFDEVRWS